MQKFWTEKKSVQLSRGLTIAFGVLVAAADMGGWWLVDFIYRSITVSHGALGRWALLAALYLCSLPAYGALVCLYRLLHNIEQERVFTAENVVLLRRVSWCCVGVAVICLLVAPIWYSMVLPAAAAAFMALIVRVVKNVFVRAIGMKDELDYTV
ncbi:MAG: DUF2975 domain-containing protein [Faecalibacterium sp.]|nr:DUF2975 domain-containing protein [Faecalibacterium sp.]